MLLAILLTSCGHNNEKVKLNMEKLKKDLLVIQDKRIYFGHRSVGNSIIKGLKDIASNFDEIQINIIDMDSTDINSNPIIHNSFFAHNRIGINGEPDTKCNSFYETIHQKIENNVDFAFFKFCFADIKAKSNVSQSFKYYKETIQKLDEKFPEINFLHMTIPIGSGSAPWKQTIKNILGKDDWSVPDNIKRNEFNKLITENFSDHLIFDLAKVESTYPDGSRSQFKKDGQVYYNLVYDYTTDGGHLNELGSKIVAKEFIHYLADVIRMHQEKEVEANITL
jgi:hypothetical protein